MYRRGKNIKNLTIDPYCWEQIDIISRNLTYIIHVRSRKKKISEINTFKD